ncbi:hypothetical protein PVAND_017091 [Polypedilum vanderplanki]|uniref:LITAF domain-containing protein n=1 Tax=Polypedilum vanderplanki TaxID=319348 RepID=A0A9J6BIE2_POLVA|nr:hypothetical protein PVAND_017091 [Polypedilum vanderplanki]
MFNSQPVSTTCPHCNSFMTTKITSHASSSTHLMAFLLCILCFPLIWIPYVTKYKATTNHTCPECNSLIGIYEPMKTTCCTFSSCCDIENFFYCFDCVECCADCFNDTSRPEIIINNDCYSTNDSDDGDCTICIAGFCSD